MGADDGVTGGEPGPSAAAMSRGRPGSTWRLVADGSHDACWNMAVDEAMLDAVAGGIAPPTLRLYRWLATAVSVGLHQDVERTIRVAACARLGIPLVRRPTGGRAILHGGDQTLSVVVPAAHLGPEGRSVPASYAVLSRAIARGLAPFGVELRAGDARAGEGREGDCFAVRTAADLVGPNGSKLVGSAQRRRDGVLLQQTSVRHLPAGVEPADVFLGTVAAPEYPLAAVSDDELQAALAFGFQAALGIRLAPGSLTGWEEERVCVLQARLLAEARRWGRAE